MRTEIGVAEEPANSLALCPVGLGGAGMRLVWYFYSCCEQAVHRQ